MNYWLYVFLILGVKPQPQKVKWWKVKPRKSIIDHISNQKEFKESEYKITIFIFSNLHLKETSVDCINLFKHILGGLFLKILGANSYHNTLKNIKFSSQELISNQNTLTNIKLSSTYPIKTTFFISWSTP